MSRLAFVRLFFQQGIDQSRQPEPLNVTSVLSLHDSAELFLQLTTDNCGISLPRFVHFMDYWKKLDPAVQPAGVKLSGERAMTRLNDLRNAFKHHGTLPSISAIQQACSDVRTFLEDNTQTVFGIAFDNIDMTEVIPQQLVRDEARKATTEAAAGNLAEAMGLLAEAYEILFTFPPMPTHFHRRPAGGTHGSFGNTIRDISQEDICGVLHPAPDDRSWRPAGAAQNVPDVLYDVIGAVREMQRAMRVTAFGIDYGQFERFKALTPEIYYRLDNTRHRFEPTGFAPTTEEFELCREFVITAALRVADQP